MLRRFVPFRRMLAVALTGVALGACSGATEDATAPSTQAGAETTSRLSHDFTLSSRSVSFTYESPAFTPVSQTVTASGLIALAMGYVVIGKIQYEPANIRDWLTVRMRPRGEVIEITFTPRFRPGVDVGGIALVPISIPGASNNPQIITVRLGDVLGCPVSGTLAYPSLNPLVGTIEETDCLSDEIDEGDRHFDVYALTVPAHATFTVMDRGQASNGGELYDPYLYLWDPVANAVVEQDDDDGDGFQSPYFDSRIIFKNLDGTPKLYYLIASQYDWDELGTYSIDIYEGEFCAPYNCGPTSAALSSGASLSERALRAEAKAKKHPRAKQQ